MDATLPLPPLSTRDPQPRGPDPRGPLGSAVNILQFVIDPLGTVARRFARYGDAYRVPQKGGYLYVVKEPDHIRDVLVTHASAFDKQHIAFKTLSLLLGDGLVTSDGDVWRRQRRLVQPAFARSRLQQYSSVMAEEADRACTRLLQRGQIDLSQEMNALTLRVVTRSLFGQTRDDDGETASAMVDLNRMFGTPRPLLRLWPGAEQRLNRSIAKLEAIIEQLIATKRRELDTADGAQGSDLLAALILARDENADALSPRELRDQLLTLYVAGHETTSHALTWTLYLLSQNPEVTAKLRAELQQVLGGRLPTFDDLPQLKYTEQVIKEGLRLYPPATTVPRHVCEDTSIGPYRVSKGCEAVVWIYHAHRNPRFYPEPERFIPERFSAEAEAARPKYAYLPFGAGQRACIGQMFAMIEAQLILATLVPRVQFEYAGKRAPRPRVGVTLSPRGGMPMRVTQPNRTT